MLEVLQGETPLLHCGRYRQDSEGKEDAFQATTLHLPKTELVRRDKASQ